MFNEIWKPLGGFEGADVLSEKYRISSKGKIYDIINHRFCKLSLCGEPKYYYVTLTNKDVRKTLRVHRLVAMSFIENHDNLPIVDHIDRDRLNNYYKNLRWVTKSKNSINTYRSDNKGNNSNPKQKGVKFKGVSSETNSVYVSGKYYGRCETGEIAAKCHDVIARKLFTNPVLNFPEEVLCEYKHINKYLHKTKPRRHICNDLREKIIYRFKHEYITKTALSRKYNISVSEISIILSNVKPKEKKPKFKFCDVKRIYLKRIIIEKYLNGEHSRRKIVEDLKHLNVTLRIVDNCLIGMPRLGRKYISPRQKEEMICYFFVNDCTHKECAANFDVDRSVFSRILKEYRNRVNWS